MLVKFINESSAAFTQHKSIPSRVMFVKANNKMYLLSKVGRLRLNADRNLLRLRKCLGG